jgi:hypothetical protein
MALRYTLQPHTCAWSWFIFACHSCCCCCCCWWWWWCKWCFMRITPPTCVYVCTCACLCGQGVHRVDGDACFDASCINEQVRCRLCPPTPLFLTYTHLCRPRVLMYVVFFSLPLQIYMKMARPLVEQAMRGVHASFLCFGPPASGKTHSLFGNGVQSGVIKRVCRRCLFVYLAYSQL